MKKNMQNVKGQMKRSSYCHAPKRNAVQPWWYLLCSYLRVIEFIWLSHLPPYWAKPQLNYLYQLAVTCTQVALGTLGNVSWKRKKWWGITDSYITTFSSKLAGFWVWQTGGYNGRNVVCLTRKMRILIRIEWLIIIIRIYLAKFLNLLTLLLNTFVLMTDKSLSEISKIVKIPYLKHCHY